MRNRRADHDIKSKRPSRMVGKCGGKWKRVRRVLFVISKIQFNGVAG
jgi:hypothetical protein